jgi:hypothetical protein
MEEGLSGGGPKAYGVGEGDGDSKADGDASVFFVEAFSGEADGDASVVAFFFVVEAFAVVDFLVVDALLWVEVAAVSFFGAQEVKNAMPMRAVIKNKTGFFIGFG